MRKVDLGLSLNPFIATFVVTVVGAGATLAILRAIDFADALAAYAPLP